MTRTECAILVTGPTASGKTTFSLELANQLGQGPRPLPGEILAADSVQLYRGHRIGGAIPDESERGNVPHHLFEILSGEHEFDVKRYTEVALQASEDIVTRRHLPIFVGGSTMYIEALLEGLAPLPEADERLRRELEQRSAPDLYHQLMECDPLRAESLHPNDRVRVMRALEVALLTGSTYTEILRKKSRQGALPLPVLVLVLLWPRDLLYHRIGERTAAMLEAGLLEETEQLFQQFGARWQSQGALGYQQALTALREGRSESLASLHEEISQGTRRYAKRQMTYLRNSFAKFRYEIRPSQTLHDGVEGVPNGAVQFIGDEAGDLGESLPKKGEKRRGFTVLTPRFDQLLEDVRLWTEKFGGDSSNGFRREVWFLSAERLLAPSSPREPQLAKP